MEKTYLTDDQKQKVLDYAMQGMPILTICKSLKISEWCYFQSQIKDPVFKRTLKELRAMYAEVLAENLLTIYDDAYSMEDIQRARGKSDNVKWLLSKAVPETYGDSVNINLNHQIDLTKVLEAANNRAMPYLSVQHTSIEPTSNQLLSSVMPQNTGFIQSHHLSDTIKHTAEIKQDVQSHQQDQDLSIQPILDDEINSPNE